LNAILEHEYEPVEGLPEALPVGERMIWQGKPSFSGLARGTFRVRGLLWYFAALLAIRAILQAADGVAVMDIAESFLGLSMLAAVAVGLLMIYASRLAEATMFTLTDKRVVIRTGVAVSVTINLPYKLIESADLRVHDDGSGDIVLGIDKRARASWVLLWPMVKPFRFVSVKPMLRGVPDAEMVAGKLADALAEYGQTPDAATPLPAPPKPPKLTFDQRIDAMRQNWPLTAVAAAVVLVLMTVSVYQLMGGGPEARPLEPTVASVDLHFVDAERGVVQVYSAETGELLEELQAGTNGFLRGALRSLVRGRNAAAIGDEIPFTVRKTESGRVQLYDSSTETLIDLRAFGVTNVDSFERFLASAQKNDSSAAKNGVAANDSP